MKTRLLGLCRGDGLAYLKIQIDDADSLSDLVVCATTSDGSPLPSSWFALGEKNDPDAPLSIAVVIPLLIKESVVVSFSQRSDQAHVSEELTITANRAKWESRLTYRLNKSLASEIRNIDDLEAFQRINLFYDYIVPNGDDFIMRGHILFPNSADPDIEFEVLDGFGRPAGLKPTFLSDNPVFSKINPSFMFKERHFTIHIPDNPRGLTIIAKDKRGCIKSSFRSVGEAYFPLLLEQGAHFWRSARVDPNYDAWFTERRIDRGIAALQQAVRFEVSPKFSIVVPLFNTPIAQFSDMFESVIQQSYGNWELIMVNASPDNEELSQIVQEAVMRDARIKYTTLPCNLGIAENTNYGIAAATGDFVCFLDHDDTLEPDALYEYASAINQYPDTDLLYSDEDKITADGKRHYNPFFKTEFDIDLLRSHNYICHFLCIRKTIVDAIGPMDGRFDGAQDLNMTLRAVEQARHVHHVSKILYHWRAAKESTASADADSRHVKDYAHEAGKLAIAEHLDRLGIAAEIEPSIAPFSHHVKYLVQGNPLVTIIIPNKDCSQLLTQCVESILTKTRYSNYEIVIVENNSVEQETQRCYERLLKRDSRISVVTWPNEFNFSKIINHGAKTAQGDYLLLLNNDTEVIAPEWLENMLGVCQRSDVGVVGAKLLYPDNTIQHAGVVLGRKLAAHHAFVGLSVTDWGDSGRTILTHQCSAVTGACLLTKRTVFEEVGGFSEDFAIAYNDVDYCLKVRDLQLGVVFEPTALLIHYESVSRGLDFTTPDKLIRNMHEGYQLMSRWSKYYVKGDPFFNPNLADNFFTLRKS